MKLTVMTFNLRYHEPKDGVNAWPNRIGKAANVIAANSPDVIGVQEALYPMLLDLQERLKDYAWVGEGRHGGRESEHCAIFYRISRFQVIEQRQFWLSETPEVAGSSSWDSQCVRTCTWIQLQCKQTGRQLTVYNTHLDHVSSDARIKGAALIYRVMAERRKTLHSPAILMGDMNCFPEEEPIRFLKGEFTFGGVTSELRDAYEKAEHPIGKTFNGFKGLVDGEPIDYIFATLEFQVVAVTVDRTHYNGGYPSDHYPVISELLLGPNA